MYIKSQHLLYNVMYYLNPNMLIYHGWWNIVYNMHMSKYTYKCRVYQLKDKSYIIVYMCK